MQRLTIIFLAIILSFVTIVTVFPIRTARADIIYVDLDATGSNNGYSWENAFIELQDALVAASSGDDIWVAEGIYYPTWQSNPNDTRTATFQMINNVGIYGGFDGTEENVTERVWETNITILSGDIGVVGDYADNSYHVLFHPEGMNLDETAILDGFTITGGVANGNEEADNHGGGMYNLDSSPTLANCTFTENSASGSQGDWSGWGGGGMYNKNSSPELINCIFEDNLVNNGFVGAGGGMYNLSSSPTLIDCVFSNNSVNTSISNRLDPMHSGRGGGMYNNDSSSPTLTNCIFENNSANSGGSGMYNNNYSSPTLTNCTFQGNGVYSTIWGAGMVNDDFSSPTLTNCIFMNNGIYLDGRGGGMYNEDSSSPYLTNCTFQNNLASNGGGIYNFGPSPNPTLINCTFSGNRANHRGGGIYNMSSGTLTNCTFSENSANLCGGMYNSDSSPTLTNCTFSGNVADIRGGGMYNYFSSPTLKNCTFTGNSSRSRGGGMFNSEGSYPILTNCIFFGNSVGFNGGGIYNYNTSPTLTNCILWGDSPNEIYGSIAVVTYSDIQGGYDGEGNIDANPLFVNPENGDFQLREGSPCIDAGNPDPIYYDGCLPPGMGSVINDMGVYGGPGNCGWLPADGFSIAGAILYQTGSAEDMPVPDTLLFLTGEGTYISHSNINGTYAYASIIPDGDYTLIASKENDVNGITPYDAARVAQYVAELYEFDEYQVMTADVTGDGEVTAFDAAKIAQYAAELNHDSQAGTWAFIPEEYTYTPLDSDQADQNFTAILYGDVTGNWTPSAGNHVADDSNVSEAIAFQFTVKAESEPVKSFAEKLKSEFPDDWKILTSRNNANFWYVGGYGVTSISEEKLRNIIDSSGFNSEEFESFLINDKQAETKPYNTRDSAAARGGGASSGGCFISAASR